MKRSGREQGSALIAVLLLVLLGTILGAGLVTMTMTGHRSVLATENDTKAQYLAETAAQIGYQALQENLDQFSQTQPSWGSLLAKISDLRDHFKISAVAPDPAKPTETYQYELKLNNTPDQENATQGIYVISGQLVGTGTAVGKTATVAIPLQISSISKAFNFAVTTQSGIWLNGGVQINGDLYGGGGIAFHRYAHYIIGNPKSTATIYPEINGRISLGPGASFYKIQNEPSQDLNNYGKHPFQNQYIVTPDQLSSFLNGHPEVADAGTVTLPSVDFSKVKTQAQYYIDTSQYRGKWPYVDRQYRTLHIGSNTDNGAGPYTGTWFVNGDLDVDGQVNISGTFYVTGDVTIQNIKTTNPIAAVIIAQGSIQVYNNNLYMSNPAVLNAFLWTQQDDLTLLGVGSNLQINGGLIAKNIILNGVRGNTQDGYGDLYFDTQTVSKPPRLTVNYDSRFLTQPPAGVPTIQGLQLRRTGEAKVSY